MSGTVVIFNHFLTALFEVGDLYSNGVKTLLDSIALSRLRSLRNKKIMPVLQNDLYLPHNYNWGETSNFTRLRSYFMVLHVAKELRRYGTGMDFSRISNL